MLAVLLARRWCKSPEIFVYSKECRKNAWSRWGSGLLTLHEYASSIIFYVQLKVYKLLWKIKLWALLTEAWSPHVILPSSSFFTGWIPEVHGPSEFTSLHGLLRLTWEGGQSWVPLGFERVPVAYVNRANFLSRSFIGFLCKPRNISLFLPSIFLSTIFFPYLSLNHLPTPFFLQVPLDPAGAGPQHRHTIQYHSYPSLCPNQHRWRSWMVCLGDEQRSFSHFWDVRFAGL